jgi:hypothetical protein
MSPATSLNTHALLSKISLDGVLTQVVDVPCVCDRVVLLTQTLHQVHDDSSVVNILPHTGEMALKSDQTVKILETGLIVRLGILHIFPQLSQTEDAIVFIAVHQRRPRFEAAITCRSGNSRFWKMPTWSPPCVVFTCACLRRLAAAQHSISRNICWWLAFCPVSFCHC